jgi:NAD(P)H-nitrite reductase large subunit
VNTWLSSATGWLGFAWWRSSCDRKAPLRVTVIGAEPGPAYNRILLSALLEGSHPARELRLKDQSWYAENGVELVSGTRVVRIERDARVVWLADRRAVAL